jgi:hypothetical protein
MMCSASMDPHRMPLHNFMGHAGCSSTCAVCSNKRHARTRTHHIYGDWGYHVPCSLSSLPATQKAQCGTQGWFAHSLHVGTCTILHTLGFSATLIKWLLHWCSEAFMTYLCNLAINARQPNFGNGSSIGFAKFPINNEFNYFMSYCVTQC